MARQSNLERIGIDEREREFIASPYKYDEQNPYSATHPDALSDGDTKGKGSGKSMSALSIPTVKGTHKSTKGTFGVTIDTDIDSKIGGKYDIEGTKGVSGAFQGDAGRDFLVGGGLNMYSEKNEYGQESVDTTKNITGQYWVK